MYINCSVINRIVGNLGIYTIIDFFNQEMTEF